MKNIKLLFIIQLLVLNVKAQWTQKGPQGIYGVISIKDLNGELWLQGCLGTYKSIDDGLTWSRTSNLGVKVNEIELISPNNLVIASNKGIFLSNDDGNTWYSSNQGMLQYDTVTTGLYFIVKDFNGRLITSGKNSYFSDNNGISWVLSNSSIGLTKCIKVSNKYIASATDSLYESINQGQNWTYLNTIGISANDYSAGIQNILYLNNNCYVSNNACTFFYKSTDNGSTWSPYTTGLPVTASTGGNLTYFDNKIQMNTNTGVFSFDDMNNSWSLSNLNQTEVIRALYKINNRYIATPRNYQNFNYSLIKSDNSGLSWQNADNGLFQTSITKLVQNPNCFIATSNNIAVEFDSINMEFNAITSLADNFCPQNSNPLSAVNSGILKNNKYYIATLGGVWKRNIGSTTWTQGYGGLPATNTSFPNQRPVNDIFITGNAPNDTIFAATDNGIYMSTDDATNFSLVPGTSGAKMQQFLKYQNTLYCAGTKIYKQTNPNNWIQFTNFTSASGITGFTATDNYLFVSNSTSLVKYAHVNGLSNFANITTGSLIAAYSVAAYDTLVFYFSEAGVFKLNTSLLGSATQADLVQIADNLPFYNLPTLPNQTKYYSYLDHGFGMAIFNGKIWLGTKGMSTFYRSLNDFGYNITVDSKLEVAQAITPIVVPNPANESIILKNILPNSAIIITSITGQTELKTSLNQSSQIDISQLNNGVHFIQVITNNNLQTIKFIKQ